MYVNHLLCDNDILFVCPQRCSLQWHWDVFCKLIAESLNEQKLRDSAAELEIILTAKNNQPDFLPQITINNPE